MPRYVRKKTDDSSKIDVNNIVKAIRDMKEKKKSERAAATEYGIKKTSLHRYKKKIDAHFPNFEQATDEQIATIIESSAGYATQMVSLNIFLLICFH